MASKRLAKGPVRGLFDTYKMIAYSRPEKYGGSYLKNMAAESPELIACAGVVGCPLQRIFFHRFKSIYTNSVFMSLRDA
jgi:hypothetical protein